MRQLPAVILMLVAVLVTVALATPATAISDVTPARVEGPNRVATAAAIAGLAFPAGTDHAVLAFSGDYHDALAGAAYAGARNAAMLLTRSNEVPAETRQALQDLGIESITLLGGLEAISEEVSAELSEDYEVTRIGGDDEFETAGGLALETVAITGSLPTVAGLSTVMLASTASFADALAASGIAYFFKMPVLYTTPAELDQNAGAAMAELEAEQAILLGGPRTIAEEVEDDLAEIGVATDRVAGPTRVETSLIMTEFSGFPADDALIARGDDWPDAVTVGQLSAALESPVVLSATPTVLPDTAERWFVDRCDTLAVVRAVGGERAVSTAVLEEAEVAAESCAGTEPETNPAHVFLVSPQEAIEADVGDAFTFEVFGRTDDQPFTGPVDLILFPCEGNSVTGAGPATFSDADGDGAADGLGTSDTGAALITSYEGIAHDDTSVVAAEPGDDGVLTFQVAADAADCTIPVVVDGDGDGAFEVDAEGRPIEEFGVAKIAWS